MKKIYISLFVFTSIISSLSLDACQSIPEVTITATVTVTSTPIPTPTSHPQFIALQEQIAASGKRFSLLPDGTIQEMTADGGRQTVPNLIVSLEGVMTITVDGQPVILDPAKTHFDDEAGLTNAEYKQEEDGKWVPAAETVTIKNNQVVLGETLPNGDRLVTDINAPEGTPADKVKAFEQKVDIKLLGETLGFTESEIDLEWRVRTGEDGVDKLVIVNPNNPDAEIAEMGNGEVVWDWNMMVDENGENVLLKVGKLVPASGGVPVDRKAQQSSSHRLMDAVKDTHPAYYKGWSTHIVLSKDGNTGLLISKLLGKEEYETGKVETRGYVYIWSDDNKPISIFVENFKARRV